jgi:hypothetical protein
VGLDGKGGGRQQGSAARRLAEAAVQEQGCADGKEGFLGGHRGVDIAAGDRGMREARGSLLWIPLPVHFFSYLFNYYISKSFY